MKVLYYGGQKSGKSHLAEEKILSLCSKKPFYIATYDNKYNDSEMHKKIQMHKNRRGDSFRTIQEPLMLHKVLKSGEFYLIDCLSMWILNIIQKDIEYKPILKQLLKIDATIVFVLNDVNRGIIPSNALSRRYVDLSGIIGQEVASMCDEVYEVVLGLPKRIK